MAGYVLSPLAADDLEDVFDYTLTTWGFEQFERYRKRLNQALDKIAQEPEVVGSRSRDDLFPGCRVFRVEHHYLVYRKGPKAIEVGRVLHERMNFEVQTSGPIFS
jgi:toxin ParE1/3/4